MKRFFIFFLLAGTISATQAQKLQKTGLEIPKLKVSKGIYGFGSDEGSYYVHNSPAGSFFVINKKLTTLKEYPIKIDKEDHFLRILTTESDVVVLLARNKKGEQKTHIVKQTYAKSTGKFKQEMVIASFADSRKERWYFYSSVSPDKKKTVFLFMVANKKSTVDGYYAAVLDEDCRMEWERENELGLSNEMFNLQDIIITNNGELYVAFTSYPENVKKATNKNLYIDLIFLTDSEKEKIQIPIENHQIGQVQLQPLKNGNVYLAALFAEDEKSYETEFLSMILNGKNNNNDKNHTKKIEEKNTHGRVPHGTTKYLYTLGIEKILELDNGNVAVVCEQMATSAYTDRTGTTYTNLRGSVSTFFINGNDASIESISTMEKSQVSGSFYTITLYGISVFPFVYGDKAGYLFNDASKKHTASSKDNKIFLMNFKRMKGKDIAISLSTQENGEKAKIELLSGNTEAGRWVREILFEETDRLILLTQSGRTAYIETLSLP